MNCFRVVAAALAAVTLFSCDPTREKPDPVQIRVQNLTPYDVFLRDAPDTTLEPLVLVRSVDALESSIRLFRYLPAQTVDRLTFYPYFLLPVASLHHPTLDSMIVYYEEFFVTDIYLTVRLSEQKKEYTANVNQWPRSVSYQKAYVRAPFRIKKLMLRWKMREKRRAKCCAAEGLFVPNRISLFAESGPSMKKPLPTERLRFLPLIRDGEEI